MLAKIEMANQDLRLRKIKEGVLASIDVEALFPSIDQKVSARMVAKELVRNGVKYQGADVNLAAQYLDSCMSRERLRQEGIAHLIPKRKAEGKRGRRPTVYTKDLSGPMKRAKQGIGEEETLGDKVIGRKLDEEEVWEGEEGNLEDQGKWQQFGRRYTEEEKTLLLSKVLMIAIEVAFGAHIYSFHNAFYRQKRGGAIRSRLTGEVCKILMDVWIAIFEKVLKDSGVEIYLLLKYVDDVNLMVALIKEGIRWDRKGNKMEGSGG